MIIYDQNHYVVITYKPKIKLFDLMIDMVNTMSLWRGTSFAFLLSALIWLIAIVNNIIAKCNLLNRVIFVHHDHIDMIKSLFKVKHLNFFK